MAEVFNVFSANELEECRVIGIGKIGSGKSETGNSLLGKKAFTSHCSSKAVTERCRFDTALRFGKKIVYIDTPGYFDIEKPMEVIQQEIIKSIGLSSPGPHAFLFITKVDRFTPEEKNTIDLCEHLFGHEFYKHLVVVFTHKKRLDKYEKSLQQFIDEAPSALQDILKRNGHVYIAIDNESSSDEKEEQIKELLSLITSVVEKNQGTHFTHATYVQMERNLLNEENTKRQSREAELGMSKGQVEKSIKINRRQVKDLMLLLRGMLASYDTSQEECSTEDAKSIQDKINQLDADYLQLNQDCYRMRYELQHIKKESRECPQKPGHFRMAIRKMIESEKVQITFNFLKEYGPGILKTSLPILALLLKK